MSNARQRKARAARRVVDRSERIKPTPETAAKLQPHPMELLLVLGRDDGGIDADQWQCAEEIIAARDALSHGRGLSSSDLLRVGASASDGSMSAHDDRLCAIWSAWAEELNRRWHVRRPFLVVERIESTLQCPPLLARALGAALDLWAKVRHDLDRPAREVSTIRRKFA